MNKSFIDNDYIRNVISEYADTVYRVAYQYLLNSADAEDVVQEVFIALYKHGRIDGAEQTKAWLIRVAINKSINVYRANKRRRDLTTSLNDIIAEESASHSEVVYALSELSAEDRELIYLHYFEGYKAEEIAKILKCTQGAVHKRLSRARQKLKKFLEDSDE